MTSKNSTRDSTRKDSFYLPILSCLKVNTNLLRIQKELKISKQNLSYYLRQLKKKGIIIQKGRGWYEVVKEVKISTKYGSILSKDISRGHAYVWVVNLKKEIKDWDKRIEILESKGIHFKLVGAKLNVPRIKVLGRNIWLCKNHLRIFDKKNQSYYGNNAIESRKYAFQELLLIVGALESKLGIFLRPFDFQWRKEHYALIKNDLAIEHNRKGELVHIIDESGEWLVIDDSLGEGGELENIGKKSFVTNIPMQKWWNDNKKHNFEVTPSFVLNTMNGIQQNQLVFDRNMSSHLEVLNEIGKAINNLTIIVNKMEEKLR